MWYGRIGNPKKAYLVITGSKAEVTLAGKLIEAFDVNTGVKLGGVFQPSYILALLNVLGALKVEGSILNKSKHIRAYADDMVLVVSV